MYQVGFGDCFMLTFEYPKAFADGRDKRHMLIDFGSTRYPKTGFDIDGVAEQIATDCDDQLDVVAVSHRHKDHMSGFGIDKSGVILDPLAPKLVVRSWTEHPRAATDATGAEADSRFASALHGGQALADALHEELFAQKKEDSRGFRGLSEELFPLRRAADAGSGRSRRRGGPEQREGI